jgi:ELWxxDGT repeat protein
VGTAEAARGKCHPKVGRARRVKTILPPTIYFSRAAEHPESLVEFQDRLYFAVNFEDRRASLWSSDGTEAGTVELKEFPPATSFGFWGRVNRLTPTGDKLFFLATEEDTGQELWVTDGTPGGTRLVEDLTPGSDSTPLGNLVGLGDELLFSLGSELWHSDGTAAGTEPLLDLGDGRSISFRNIRLGDKLLFLATSASHGTELWETDGTAAGTMRVRKLDAGEVYVFDVRVSEHIAFLAFTDEDGSTEVWKTDGTQGGTLRLRTFGPHKPARLLGQTGSSSDLYIVQEDSATRRLSIYRLRTDGSGERAYVKALPNPYASNPSAQSTLGEVSVADERIYFSIIITTSSTTPAPTDSQLWVTDGTKHGTRRLRDIAPGNESSYPREFIRVGDRVFFSAFDDTEAGQLWSVRLRDTCHAYDGK